ncbi:MAG: methyl-accepting chemotaxis protein [Gemmatimonadota bacterium]|nr:methyl-accepting chemotaxis protein [Gemmatimonadota bacterium]
MTSPAGGRFDRSFAIRMIRDFMLALLAIVVLELAGRYALARYEFATHDRERTRLAAERLAGDVKDIMLNRGGPVAARTVYPVIRRHSEQADLEIAIVPSSATVRAIERQFGFTPAGIPTEWPDGAHHEARVEIVAEPFCIGCHVTSKPGDVLGHVAVRYYLSHRLAEWWSEARMVSMVGTGNVLLHTIVLFLLLRVRMEPLLRLRSVAAGLARGRMNLRSRVDVRSDDEFGELAHDLNEFLDRICLVFEDLEEVLKRVAAVNERLLQVSRQLDGRVESAQGLVREAMRWSWEAREVMTDPAAGGREEAASRLTALMDSLGRLSELLEDDVHYRGEIRLLEERMRTVAETGRSLLARVQGPPSGSGDEPDA